MQYRTEGKTIILSFPAGNNGKYRFKKRVNNTDFGEAFPTRTENFDSTAYMEWQIGYDVPVKDVSNGEKSTKLKDHEFVGANGKSKYLYELSELFYEILNLKLISHDAINSLLLEIKSYKEYIDDREISVEKHPEPLLLNGINYHETSIKLPTLFMNQTSDSTQIEISVEKQQYATGVQPMVYYCIPLRSFRNGPDFEGRPSRKGEFLEYLINEDNANNLLLLMKVFGMTSKRHQHDIVEILMILQMYFSG